jgi:hypothetical protein
MTVINQSELSQILYVDQALMWCVIELEHSNHHIDNYYLSDNAAVRAESQDFVSWEVTQDSDGNGQFVFTALLPILNRHPLLQQNSIIECVMSYTIFRLTDEQITYPSDGKGMLLPTIPTYINTLEKLLVWLVQLVEGVNRYIKLINALVSVDFVETVDTPAPTIDLSEGVVTIAGLEPLAPILAVVDNGTGGAEENISQYENAGSDPNATPEWYMDAVDNLQIYYSSGASGGGGGGGNPEPTPVDPGNGNNGGLLDTLPVCKEQDPKIISFSKDGLLNITNV